MPHNGIAWLMKKLYIISVSADMTMLLISEYIESCLEMFLVAIDYSLSGILA